MRQTTNSNPRTSDGRVVLDAGGHLAQRLVGRQDGQDEAAVGDENFLPGPDGLGEALVAARELGRAPLEGVVGRKDDRFALDEVDLLLAVGEEPGANLGALGVEKDGCTNTNNRRGYRSR
jgi:hypothetical protein